jgi:hypothetical protein
LRRRQNGVHAAAWMRAENWDGYILLGFQTTNDDE